MIYFRLSKTLREEKNGVKFDIVYYEQGVLISWERFKVAVGQW